MVSTRTPAGAAVGARCCERLLLMQPFPVDPVREPLEDERTVLDRRKDELRDARVVPHDVALRVLLLREKNLVEVRDLEVLPAPEVERAFPAFFLDRSQLCMDRCRV